MRGLWRRNQEMNIVRVQDVGLGGRDDEAVLAWAAVEGRILLTHDVTTITDFAYRRILRGESMPGVFEVRQGAAIGLVIEDILLIEQCSEAKEWEGRIAYLPFRRQA